MLNQWNWTTTKNRRTNQLDITLLSALFLSLMLYSETYEESEEMSSYSSFLNRAS